MLGALLCVSVSGSQSELAKRDANQSNSAQKKAAAELSMFGVVQLLVQTAKCKHTQLG
jgi:hypothetical protein